MASWKSVMVAVAIFVITVAFAFGAFQIADASQDSGAANEKTVTNESIIQYESYQLVNKSTEEFTAGFNDTVTVYNNSSAELVAGEDYDWNETDGAIKFFDTDSTTIGEPATITYNYDENTDAVKKIAGPLKVIVNGVGRLPLMAAGLGFAVLLFAFGAIIMRQMRNIRGPSGRR